MSRETKCPECRSVSEEQSDLAVSSSPSSLDRGDPLPAFFPSRLHDGSTYAILPLGQNGELKINGASLKRDFGRNFGVNYLVLHLEPLRTDGFLTSRGKSMPFV